MERQNARSLPWEYLPPEMCCGSGMACWRRLKEWHEAGVWRVLLQELLLVYNPSFSSSIILRELNL
jgi:transposase